MQYANKIASAAHVEVPAHFSGSAGSLRLLRNICLCYLVCSSIELHAAIGLQALSLCAHQIQSPALPPAR